MTTHKNILAHEVIMGENVTIEPSAIIRGPKGKSKKISIGDNVYIGQDVQIICDHFEIGDYGKIHHHTNIHGYKPCILGHNIWVGQYCILDCIGGITIGDNCGIGAHSQLWSHIKYGDTLEGCRFFSEQSLTIGKDVWFVGHSIISPITAKDKSMSLVGSVITKDMEYNTIYSGVPAKPISDKIGFQFNPVTTQEKLLKMKDYLNESGVDKNKIEIVVDLPCVLDKNITYFIISTREYTKRRTKAEIDFMNFLLPEKAKFTPYKSNT